MFVPSTSQDLQEMLLENEVTGFDPVTEAFKVRSLPKYLSLLLVVIKQVTNSCTSLH
jgi:hypothetical protein